MVRAIVAHNYVSYGNERCACLQSGEEIQMHWSAARVHLVQFELQMLCVRLNYYWLRYLWKFNNVWPRRFLCFYKRKWIIFAVLKLVSIYPLTAWFLLVFAMFDVWCEAIEYWTFDGHWICFRFTLFFFQRYERYNHHEPNWRGHVPYMRIGSYVMKVN